MTEIIFPFAISHKTNESKQNADLYSVFTPYSVGVRENTDQKNSDYGQFFLRSVNVG